ncbi:MAG: excisionase [Clostridia bacterium]|nr:excisionase [Clostridia bacterium]
MNEKTYVLMHRDEGVCVLVIDEISGAILRVSRLINLHLVPLGGKIDVAMLKKWWQRRAVPIGQGKIQRILERLGIATPQGYLVKNLGLSLTDHYWIKPIDMELGWKDINLFTNDFKDPVGDMQFGQLEENVLDLQANTFSPSSSLQGELRKKWIISDGKRYLVKGNRGSNSQESLNEVVATLLHKKQGKHDYVAYTPIPYGDSQQIFCTCESFTSDDLEFIPAIEIVESKKKDNSVSMYEHFIQMCVQHGLEDEEVRSFLEYQILSDFVMTNTDRHFNNFGVLRNTHTLEFVKMAPIFDSGNSMFWQNPRTPEFDDLTKIEVNSFRGFEKQLIEYVKDKKCLDISKLPTEDEIREIYSQDSLIPCVNSILKGYRKKIDMLADL